MPFYLYEQHTDPLLYTFNGYQMVFEAGDKVRIISQISTKIYIRQSDYTRLYSSRLEGSLSLMPQY